MDNFKELGLLAVEVLARDRVWNGIFPFFFHSGYVVLVFEFDYVVLFFSLSILCWFMS